MKTMLCFIPLCAAGCSGDTPAGPSTQIPGADVADVTSGTLGVVAKQSVKPCGYQTLYDYTANGQPQLHEDTTVSIRYDGAGRELSETGVDENGHVVLQTDIEYDAMGNWVKETQNGDGGPTYTFWAVYDSFGRVVRWSTDQTGDGVEDLVYTYDYGTDGQVDKTHVVKPTQTYDVTYVRDAQGRVLVARRDNGPDGTLDEQTTYDYDDAGRISMWQTVSARNAAIVASGATTYDADNNVLTDGWSTTQIPGNSATTLRTENQYASGRQISTEYVEDVVQGTDRISISQKITWKYDGCD